MKVSMKVPLVSEGFMEGSCWSHWPAKASLKVSNAINKLIHNEKVSQIDEIKTYIRDSVDDDFNFNVNGEEKNIDDFCDLLDLFSEDIEKKTLNLKSTKKSKSKKPKKKSFLFGKNNKNAY